MPIEVILFEKLRPEPFEECLNCGDKPFKSFMRGQVINYWRKLFRLPCWCIICSECKEIVGHEKILSKEERLKYSNEL